MRIRRAVAGDRDRIDTILRATERFTEREIGWAMELVDTSLAAAGGEYEVHVLEDDHGEVAGYVLFGPTPMADGVYDLYWIAVDPACQGRGHGQALLGFVENELRVRGGRMLLIETSSKSSYAPTVRFYQRAGYTEISRIKDFYRIENDKLVFSKNLTLP